MLLNCLLQAVRLYETAAVSFVKSLDVLQIILSFFARRKTWKTMMLNSPSKVVLFDHFPARVRPWVSFGRILIPVSRYQLKKSYGLLSFLLFASRWIRSSVHHSWAGKSPESGWSAIASEPWETDDDVSGVDPVQVLQTHHPSAMRHVDFGLEPLHLLLVTCV